jgi:hypothetical protein
MGGQRHNVVPYHVSMGRRDANSAPDRDARHSQKGISVTTYFHTAQAVVGSRRISGITPAASLVNYYVEIFQHHAGDPRALA